MKKKEVKNLTRPMEITIKAVVVKDKQEVLILKRAKDELFNRGKWDLPGGKLEKGETIPEALRREVKEETGLDVKVENIINFSELPKEHKHFKNEKRGLRFLVRYQGGEAKVNSKEHEKHLWLSIDEAIEKLNPKDEFENEKRETLIQAKAYLQMQEAEAGWKRAVADLDNFKKRTAKNNEEFKKYCIEDFVLDLLPVIDNFEMAVEHVPEEDRESGWMVGIMHIQKQLETVLSEKGVEKIPVKKGDGIDEKIHEVISGKSKKGRVKKVLKAGYRIGDRIIRPASVISE